MFFFQVIPYLKKIGKKVSSQFLNDACYGETSQCYVSPDAILVVVGEPVEVVEHVKVC